MKVLDLYCCSGGATDGAINLGMTVTGMDIRKPTSYAGKFILQDVTELEAEDLKKYDFIMSSPPCQQFSRATALHRKNTGHEYANHIEFTRQLIIASGRPGYIENVPSAPIKNDITLCGTMFNLPIIRHRKFELINWSSLHPVHRCKEFAEAGNFVTVVGNEYNNKTTGSKALGLCELSHRPRTRWEINQAIPPNYSEWILNRYINFLTIEKIKREKLILTDWQERQHTKKTLVGQMNRYNEHGTRQELFNRSKTA